VAFETWRSGRRARGGTAARDIGLYSAYGPEAWNDEVLVGSQDGDMDGIVQKLLDEEGRQAEFLTQGGDKEMAGLRRRSEADEQGDFKSLERALERTLYLVVKYDNKGPGNAGEGDGQRRNGWWGFPSAPVQGSEGLKEVCLCLKIFFYFWVKILR